MAEPTPSEALGQGLGFESNWDFDVQNGSITLISGIDALARDLSRVLQEELNDIRGEVITPNQREEIRIVVKTVLGEVDRVQDFTILDIIGDRGQRNQIGVKIEIVAQTGEVGEYILPQTE